MISSTAVDLPDHRRQVMNACVRQSFFPIAMEDLPARDATGIQVSMEMVDQADIYIGVYAWRYGWVPPGSEISITEMEFNRAVERKQRGELKEILIFVMHDEHEILPRSLEADAHAQQKLKRLKERASSGRVRKEFRNSDDLRGLVVEALADFRRRSEAVTITRSAETLHASSVIPVAPIPYIAHPYVLLQTKDVVGRQDELNELTDWITDNKLVPAGTRIFTVVAIGGMGKSALTWKWFQDIAAKQLPNLAGCIWWSFYESDAHWDNFLIRALAYTAKMSEDEVRELSSAEREERLLQLLDQRAFLIGLDGLERILLAYAGMDAAHLPDDNLDQQTANAIADAAGLPDDVRETYFEKHRLRKCADPRAGAFLRKLAMVSSSRVLISTRLYPAELQKPTAEPIGACHALFLRGLTDDDALTLWRAFIGSNQGDRDEDLSTLFRTFGNYPLLLRALAGEVAQYRPAPGNFSRWRKDHPGFDPAALPLKNAKTHVLEYALSGLTQPQRRLLHTLAAFRMPSAWDTVRALATAEGGPCADDRALDAVLTNLEDRGLVSWDKTTNRYDLHPIVRGVVWATLNPAARHDVHGQLHAYFSAIPTPSWQLITSVEELTPAIELFYTLTNLERFEEAYSVFLENIESALLKRLSAGRLLIQLLELLLPNGPNTFPPLETKSKQSAVVNSLALGHDITGEPGKAAFFFERAVKIDQNDRRDRDLSIHLCNLALALWPTGKLRHAEKAIRRAMREAWLRTGYKTRTYGVILGARGEFVEALSFLERELLLRQDKREQGAVSAHIAQCYIWQERDEEVLVCQKRLGIGAN